MVALPGESEITAFLSYLRFVTASMIYGGGLLVVFRAVGPIVYPVVSSRPRVSYIQWCVCVCLCVCVCVHMPTHTCIHIYIHTHMFTCTPKYIHVPLNVHIHLHAPT